MLIKTPESWPQPLVAVLAMAVLAALDLTGAVVAKEAVERRSAGLAALGAATFLVLFWVYASSLQYAELAPVTFGWIVILQVGVLLIDRLRYGAQLSHGAWAAVALILAAQAYLVFAPSAPTTGAPGESTSAGPVTQEPAGRAGDPGRPPGAGAHACPGSTEPRARDLGAGRSDDDGAGRPGGRCLESAAHGLQSAAPRAESVLGAECATA